MPPAAAAAAAAAAAVSPVVQGVHMESGLRVIDQQLRRSPNGARHQPPPRILVILVDHATPYGFDFKGFLAYGHVLVAILDDDSSPTTPQKGGSERDGRHPTGTQPPARTRTPAGRAGADGPPPDSAELERSGAPLPRYTVYNVTRGSTQLMVSMPLQEYLFSTDFQPNSHTRCNEQCGVYNRSFMIFPIPAGRTSVLSTKQARAMAESFRNNPSVQYRGLPTEWQLGSASTASRFVNCTSATLEILHAAGLVPSKSAISHGDPATFVPASLCHYLLEQRIVGRELVYVEQAVGPNYFPSNGRPASTSTPHGLVFTGPVELNFMAYCKGVVRTVFHSGQNRYIVHAPSAPPSPSAREPYSREDEHVFVFGSVVYIMFAFTLCLLA